MGKTHLENRTNNYVHFPNANANNPQRLDTYLDSINSSISTINSSISTINTTLGRLALSIKDYGAVGDNSTDDTAAVQSALTAAISSHRPLFVNSGTYKITSGLTTNGPITLFGLGWRSDGSASAFSYTPTTGDMLTHSANGPIVIQGIQFTGSGSASAGALVKIAGGTQNINSIIRDCYFSSGFNHIDIDGAAWTIDDNIFQANITTGTCLIWANSFSPAGGDAVCVNNTFAPGSSGSAFTINSGSGLKFTNNKISAGNHGITINIGTNNLADFNIVGNSLESNGTDHLTLTQSGAGTLFNMVISGNQISGATNCLNFSSTATDYLTGLIIVANQIQAGGNGTGIILNSARDAVIANNSLYSPGGTQTGIKLNTGVHHTHVSGNRLFAFSTAIDISSGVGVRVFIQDNPGYNPIGASALSPGASAWTYTAGNTPETIYVSASTSITAATIGGTSILPAATAANAVMTIELAPLDAVVITYTGSLTGKKYVH